MSTSNTHDEQLIKETTRSMSRESGDSRRLLSFLIPVKDEELTLQRLYLGISVNVPEDCDFEVLLIDDGSKDGSWEIISALAEVYPENVRGIRLRSNRGKATALNIGYRAAAGDVVFTMDADLQDDPREITRFLSKLDEGYGLVSGWKKLRHDPWHKVLPSRVFNRLLSFFSGVKLHDHNCGFKCYDATLVKQLKLHGEWHRMVPALAAMRGFPITEIVVTHHARRHGKSKYGIERFLRGFSDMLTIGFLKRFGERPSHFINGVSLAYFAVSTLLGSVAVWKTMIGASSAVCTMYGMGTALFAGMGIAAFVAGQISELVIQGPLNSKSNDIVDSCTSQGDFKSLSRVSKREVSSTNWITGKNVDEEELIAN